MPTSSDPVSNDAVRIAAQRNAAFAAAFILTGVIICAGWALEVLPRQKAQAYRIEKASLYASLASSQRALNDSQAALVHTQEALKQAEAALTNTQEALRQAQRAPR